MSLYNEIVSRKDTVNLSFGFRFNFSKTIKDKSIIMESLNKYNYFATDMDLFRQFTLRFFFYMPSPIIDKIGCQELSSFGFRKYFRMKPGYQVILRRYRVLLLKTSGLRFYRHKRINDWVSIMYMNTYPLGINFHGNNNILTPINRVYNWKYRY